MWPVCSNSTGSTGRLKTASSMSVTRRSARTAVASARDPAPSDGGPARHRPQPAPSGRKNEHRRQPAQLFVEYSTHSESPWHLVNGSRGGPPTRKISHLKNRRDSTSFGQSLTQNTRVPELLLGWQEECEEYEEAKLQVLVILGASFGGIAALSDLWLPLFRLA